MIDLPHHKITTDEAIALAIVAAIADEAAAQRFAVVWEQILRHNETAPPYREGAYPRHRIIGGDEPDQAPV